MNPDQTSYSAASDLVSTLFSQAGLSQYLGCIIMVALFAFQCETD